MELYRTRVERSCVDEDIMRLFLMNIAISRLVNIDLQFYKEIEVIRVGGRP